MKQYEKYKDSGCQQIGRIPDKWESVKMKYRFIQRSEKGHPNEPILCATQSSGVIPQSMYENRVVVVNKGFEGLKLVKKGDFVISLRSFQGGLEYAHYQGIISAAYTILQPKEKEFANYYKYLFKSHPFIQLLQTCVTGIREGQNINYALLGKNFIPIPPSGTQEKIVAFLDAKTLKIDECICLRERELQTLNELKQSQIASVVTRGLNPNVPMKDSGIPWIGQIPIHWELKRLGTRFHSRTEINSDLEFSKAYKFNYGSIVPKDEVGDLSEYADTYIKYTKVLADDIMINGLNLNYDFVSQRVAIVPSPGIITSAYLVLRPYPSTYSAYFCYLFKAMDAMKLFHGMGTGIRLTLSFDELKKQLIPIPPVEEQKAIVEFIEEKQTKIDSMISSLNAEIERLKEYKQSLISDVVTGQINVQDEII